ncbi:hypothetical protein AAOGI_34970 [Agarivorans albus]
MFGLSINKIRGDSMSPLLPKNSYVMFHRYYLSKHFKAGDVVKVLHPKFGLIVKRIGCIDKYGFIWLRGENPSSVSTIDMGPVRASRIKGKVLFWVKPS